MKILTLFKLIFKMIRLVIFWLVGWFAVFVVVVMAREVTFYQVVGAGNVYIAPCVWLPSSFIE